MRKFLLIIPLILVFIVVVWIINKPQPQEKTLTIRGIILPHHGFAKELLNDSFSKLKEKINPKIVVIYGTNHYFPISDIFTTTESSNEEFKLENVLVDDVRIEKEHSIQTITPYIKEYFPNSKIVPIIVSTSYKNLNDVKERVGKFVDIFGSNEVLYIASVDFSHNLSLDESLKNNNESIETIQSFDYQKLLTYYDEHIDSSLSIISFLMTMEKINAKNWELWSSTHGALIKGDISSEGTSYVVGAFSN